MLNLFWKNLKREPSRKKAKPQLVYNSIFLQLKFAATALLFSVLLVEFTLRFVICS